MDDVIRVCVSNGVGNLDAVFDYKVEGKSNVGRDGVRENLPFDKLHDDTSLTRFFKHIFDSTNIGMIQ